MVPANRVWVRKDGEGAHGVVATAQKGSRMKWSAAIAGCVAAVVGCATLQQVLRFQEPTIQLQEIRITGLSLSGGSFDLALDVFNPNDFGLRTIRLQLGIDLEQVHFGDAALDTAVALPGQQHSLVTVPVRFEWA